MNHATGSNFLLTENSILASDFLNLNPMAYSTKTKEIPSKNNETIYGIMNHPPPWEYKTFGKRQIFPRPTAEPIIAIINAKLLFHSDFFVSVILSR